MKFTDEQIMHVLHECGLLPRRITHLRLAKAFCGGVVAIIISAMENQEEPCDANNALEDEINVLRAGQKAITTLESAAHAPSN